MDSSSSIGNNIFCAIYSTALVVGPIVFAIGVNQSWKASERAGTALIVDAVEGGSREEELKDSSQIEEEKKECFQAEK